MPTWTLTQHLHRVTKLEATLSVKPCVSKTSKNSQKRRLEPHQAPGRPGAMIDPLNNGEGEVYPQTNTDGERYIRRSDDPAKSFQPQNQEEQEFYTIVLHSICATCRKDPADARDFPFNIAVWSQFTSNCLWSSLWLSKDHEDSKRMDMNKSFPRRQD